MKLDGETMTAIQIYGADPVRLAEAARVADDSNLRGHSTAEPEGTFEQSAAFEFEKGFVPSHAGAFPAGQDEGRTSLHLAMIHPERKPSVLANLLGCIAFE